MEPLDLNSGSTVKVDRMTTHAHTNEVPNHHAHHAGFAGLTGLLAALSMTVGRETDAAFAIDLARLDATDHVVDIGCGPGTAVRRAARMGARATGVDPAGVMLRVARRLGDGDRITYLDGGAESLPLPAASATVVWSIASIHHWPQLDEAIARRRLAALDAEIERLQRARAYLEGALLCRYDHPATDCRVMGAEIDRRLTPI